MRDRAPMLPGDGWLIVAWIVGCLILAGVANSLGF